MRVITPPAVEPITLAEVKVQQGILTDDTVGDALITRRIKEARQFAEKYMQRAIITQTLEVQLNEFYCPDEKYHIRKLQYRGIIKLPFPNLLSIVSVKYIDIDGVEQTMSSGDYTLDLASLVGSVRPVYGTEWPTPRDEINAVRIRYTCGYGPAATDVPEEIKEALHLIVGHMTNYQQNAESGGLTPTRIPFAARDLLDHYKVVEFV